MSVSVSVSVSVSASAASPASSAISATSVALPVLAGFRVLGSGVWGAQAWARGVCCLSRPST